MSDNEKRDKKRAMILNEIVSSEETYLKRLIITKEVFMIPIQERNLLSAAEIEGQFGELGVIIDLHTNLSNKLTSAHAAGTLQVGHVFLEICPEFGVYKGYLKCFEKALVKRGKLLTSNRRFADYLVEAKADPRCQGFSMESLLIEPVQRIPRYRLLLEDLLKSTLETHEDYASITSALEGICIIAAENNEAIRQQEELDKVYQVMQQMEYNGSINLLDNEDRKFLKQDDLFRQCRRGRKSFRFWLFNDKMLYGEASRPYILGKYNLNREIPLSKCVVSREQENDEFVMRIESPFKSFIVWFSDEKLRDEWVSAVTQCVEQCRSVEGGEAVALAPIWNPDAASSKCANCKTEFSFINRKHHCRNCGCIVCDGCSRSRVLINHVDKSTAVRVCNKCRDTILTSADAGTSDRERRHTADINFNSLYPSPKNAANASSSGKLSSIDDVKMWHEKQLLVRSQSTGPDLSPTKQGKQSTMLARSQSSVVSGFVPAKPKPTDRAPPPPPPGSLPPAPAASPESSTIVPMPPKPNSRPPKPPKTESPALQEKSHAPAASPAPASPTPTPPTPALSTKGVVPVPGKVSASPPARPAKPSKPQASLQDDGDCDSEDSMSSHASLCTPQPLLKTQETPPPAPPRPPPPPPPPPPRAVVATPTASPVVVPMSNHVPVPVPAPKSKPVPVPVKPAKTRPATDKPSSTPPPAHPSTTSSTISSDDSRVSEEEEDSTSNPTVFFPLDELQDLNSQHRLSLLFRNGIEEVTSKEMYLTDEDFLMHMGCDKKTFSEWPAWKKTAMRKELGLF